MSFHLFNEALGKEKDIQGREKFSVARGSEERNHTWEREIISEREKRSDLSCWCTENEAEGSAQKTRSRSYSLVQTVQQHLIQKFIIWHDFQVVYLLVVAVQCPEIEVAACGTSF